MFSQTKNNVMNKKEISFGNKGMLANLNNQTNAEYDLNLYSSRHFDDDNSSSKDLNERSFDNV
jgi:hypothetical protein